MDELSNWFEVIRSLLPQSYEMVLSPESHSILVGAPRNGTFVRLAEGELAEAHPGELITRVRQQLDHPRRALRVA